MRKLLLRLCLLLGMCFVVLCVPYSWFVVPTSTQPPGGLVASSPEHLSRWAIVFQWTTVIATILSVAIYHLQPQRRRVAAAVAAAGLVAVLFFPHVQQAWQPRVTANAAWLQIQHENLTWFGGDIFRSQELEDSHTQIQMYLSDSPRHVTVMKLPIWTLHSFGLNQLPSLLDWLGYTNTFCQFVARGWLFAVAGLSCVLLSMVFQQQTVCVANLRAAIQTFMCCGLVGVLIAWQAPFRASLVLHQAADATYRGLHGEALEFLQRAADIWPPLEEDTWFVTQQGLSQTLVGVDSPHSQLHAARALEVSRQFDRAAADFRRLASTVGTTPAIRREACRGILRHSIRALSSGERRKAIDGFRFVVGTEPNNIKSLYALQVAYLQQGEMSKAKLAHARLAKVYDHLNFPNKKIVVEKSKAMVKQPQLFLGERTGGSETSSR